MFLGDYHTHTTLSPDAQDSMYDMAVTAHERGITEICFTNHAENCAEHEFAPNQFPPFEAWDEMQREYRETKEKLAGTIDISLGLELGCPHHDPEEAKRIYALPFLDFIIGSIHNMRGTDDLYYFDYTTTPMEKFTRQYLEEYIELAETGCYDVLGHVGLMRKYAARDNVAPVDLMAYPDLLRALFRVVIDAGKGIELNMSGMYGNLRDTMPDLAVLKLYRECGGEIVTVGSDAHTVKHVGLHIAEGYEILRTAGFRYVAKYRSHKPEFIKI